MIGDLEQPLADAGLILAALEVGQQLVVGVHRLAVVLLQPLAFRLAEQRFLKDGARVLLAGGSVWARLFPFLLVMMALTGAFYPAVDLCETDPLKCQK